VKIDNFLNKKKMKKNSKSVEKIPANNCPPLVKTRVLIFTKGGNYSLVSGMESM
jgi:hypothetical protein